MSKAQFIGGSTFWDTFCAFRVCLLSGRFGSGKTALAVIMAARLLREKRVSHVVSNIPMTFSVKEIPTPLLDTAIVMDEAWNYIEGRRDVLDYAAFVRKFNHYLILPSVFPVHSRLSFFMVQRVFNAYTVGIPAWFYKWTIRQAAVKEAGYFGVFHPKAVFNHYPTKYVPGDDAGISKAVSETSKHFGYKGTRNEQSRSTEVLFDTGSTSADAIQDSIEDFEFVSSGIVDDIEAQTKRFQKAVSRRF